MTDEEYVFTQEIRERNSMRRGAYAKKGGSKSRKCTLPSDNMTKAEWKRRNGKMFTYNLNLPMKWAELKLLPVDVQRDYLTNLVAKYDARLPDVAEMLGLTKGTMYNLNRYNFHDNPIKYRRGTEASPKWKAFINFAKADEPTPDEAPAMLAIGTTPSELTEGSLTFAGAPANIMDKIGKLLDMDATYKITVTFERSV